MVDSARKPPMIKAMMAVVRHLVRLTRALRRSSSGHPTNAEVVEFEFIGVVVVVVVTVDCPGADVTSVVVVVVDCPAMDVPLVVAVVIVENGAVVVEISTRRRKR